MLFNKGVYEHKSGFEISVDDAGEVMLSPNHPVSIRLADIFGVDCWTQKDSTVTTTDVEG